MAGTNSNFNPKTFRDGIRLAMNMGQPDRVADRATFRWVMIQEFAKEDTTHRPYSWTATPTVQDTHPDVQIPVAVETSGSAEQGESVGVFNPIKAILTVLDEDYEQVRGADQVLLGQNVYRIDFVGPPQGLFDVTIYRIYCTAQDES